MTNLTQKIFEKVRFRGLGSIEYKIRKSDNLGFEYFYGYDRTRGQTIKSFYYTANFSPNK